MKIVDDHEVDRPEQVIRFVCGAILGLVFAVVLLFEFDLNSPFSILAALLGCMVGCGLGALFGGDRFWYGLLGRDGP